MIKKTTPVAFEARAEERDSRAFTYATQRHMTKGEGCYVSRMVVCEGGGKGHLYDAILLAVGIKSILDIALPDNLKGSNNLDNTNNTQHKHLSKVNLTIHLAIP
jgi:hypothetical protein